jgi:diacylglycerol kinase family enzyme
MCGVGLDAAIILRLNPWLKRRAGALAYVVAGIVTAIRTRPWHVRMTIEGGPGPEMLYWMVVGNTRNYGGLAHVAHHALADDGVVDAVVMRRGGLRLVTDGVRVLLRRHERSGNILYRQAEAMEIETAGIPVQLDGDDAGETPLRIGVAPASLTVVVPAGAKLPIFSEAP